jgi:hypothetical protein
MRRREAPVPRRGILDGACARRSAKWLVGTKGSWLWSNNLKVEGSNPPRNQRYLHCEGDALSRRSIPPSRGHVQVQQRRGLIRIRQPLRQLGLARSQPSNLRSHSA